MLSTALEVLILASSPVDAPKTVKKQSKKKLPDDIEQLAEMFLAKEISKKDLTAEQTRDLVKYFSSVVEQAGVKSKEGKAKPAPVKKEPVPEKAKGKVADTAPAVVTAAAPIAAKPTVEKPKTPEMVTYVVETKLAFAKEQALAEKAQIMAEEVIDPNLGIYRVKIRSPKVDENAWKNRGVKKIMVVTDTGAAPIEETGTKIPIAYESMLDKNIKGEIVPNFHLFRAQMKKLNIPVRKEDPIWRYIVEKRELPVEMILKRAQERMAELQQQRAELSAEQERIEEERVPGVAKVETPTEEEDANYLRMRDYLKSLKYDELYLTIDEEEFSKRPEWYRRAIDDEILSRKNDYVQQVTTGQTRIEDVPELVQQDVAERLLWTREQEVENLKRQLPKEVKDQLDYIYEYEDILDKNGMPNYWRFKKAIENRGYETADKERMARWFYWAQLKKELPEPESESWGLTWNEWRKVFKNTYQDMELKEDMTRDEAEKYLWKNFAKAGNRIPNDVFKVEPVMPHSDFMRIYLSRPWKLGFKRATELWKKYGRHGNMPPNSELPKIKKYEGWTSGKVDVMDIDHMMEWIEENDRLVSYADLVHILDVSEPEISNEEKAKNRKSAEEQAKLLIAELPAMTHEGNRERFKKALTDISKTVRGRDKVRYMALIAGYNEMNTDVVDNFFYETFGRDKVNKYDPHMQRTVALSVLSEMAPRMYENPEDRAYFEALHLSDAGARNAVMREEMDKVTVHTKDIDVVSDKERKMFYDYVKSVGGRPVTEFEFFAAYPNLTKEQAKAIYSSAQMELAGAEYGRGGRRPTKEGELRAVMDNILDKIEDARHGADKNKVAKALSDLRLFNAEWQRRKGKPYVDNVTLDEMGTLSIPLAMNYADGRYTLDMIPQQHIDRVHAWMKEHLRYPTKEEVTDLVGDSAEALFIMANVVKLDWTGELKGSNPTPFTDDEIDRMARRKGMSGPVLRGAMRAWKEGRIMPLSAIEVAEFEFARQQQEIYEKFGKYEASPGAKERLTRIIVTAPDRATAIQHIDEYIAELDRMMSAKVSERTQVHVELAELEAKKRKSAEVKARIDELNAKDAEIQKEMMVIKADTEQAETDKKFRIYRVTAEDYLKSQARFGPDNDPDQQYSNFSRGMVEVARKLRGIGEDKDTVHVDLDDIYNYWVVPIETGLNKVIADKAKEMSDPVFKEYFTLYKRDLKAAERLEEEAGEIKEDMDAEGVKPEDIERMSQRLEMINRQRRKYDADLRSLSDKLTNYKEFEAVAPSIQKIQEEYEGKKKWPDDWQKRVAVAAYMNRAREMGVYDYTYQMATVAQQMDPPLKEMPLTIYPPASNSVREALFGEWLQQALTVGDIHAWSIDTIAEFIGDDLAECDWGRYDDILSKKDMDERKKYLKDSDQDRRKKKRSVAEQCAVRKAKVIQSQAISEADPVVLTPIIERAVRTVELGVSEDIANEMDNLRQSLSESLNLGQNMAEKIKSLESNKASLEKELAQCRRDLTKVGVPTAVVKQPSSKRETVEPLASIETEEQRQIMKKMKEIEKTLAQLGENIQASVEEGCKGDEVCTASAMRQITELEDKVRRQVRDMPTLFVGKREFCFTDAEWDTLLLALSERKIKNQQQLKAARDALDIARDAGISRDMPLYENMARSLEGEHAAIQNLEEFIKKHDRSSFVCQRGDGGR